MMGDLSGQNRAGSVAIAALALQSGALASEFCGSLPRICVASPSSPNASDRSDARRAAAMRAADSLFDAS